MIRRIFTLSCIILLSVFVISCNKDDDNNTDDNNNNTTTEVVKDYSGSASYGDLVTFSINQTNSTYSVDNETTGATSSGTYSVMTGNFEGVYQVTAGGNDFYAIELDDKIIAANFPTGNPMNTISFGVSSDIDNSTNLSNISGDYIWIIIDENGINDATTLREWGLLTVLSDGNWYLKSYASGDGLTSETPTMSPIDLPAGSLPLTNTTGDDMGTYEINGTHKERLLVHTDVDLTGFVYATANEGAFILDRGTGRGFLFGLKVSSSSVTIANLANTYKFVDVWSDGGTGAGNYTISSDGTTNWSHIDESGTTDTGSFNLIQCTNDLHNVFYAETSMGGESLTVYCILLDNMIMHFAFNDSGEFKSFGAGAKI